MDIIVDIFFAVLLISMWTVLLKYRKVVRSWTWNFVWAEKYLWNWWTYLVLILLGCFFIIWWFLYPFWGLEMMIWVNSNSEKEF